MSDQQTNAYDERISQVCEFIYQNPDEELTLEVMSYVAAFSKYHFHSVFSVYSGMSVTKFIQLSRLKRALLRLAFEDDKRVIDIALEAGFESPEAFSRAFNRTFDQSPPEFRAEPKWPEWHMRFKFNVKPLREIQINVDIVNFETTKVALIEHLGRQRECLKPPQSLLPGEKKRGCLR
jgi:AraC family transcriptional regulator